MILHQHFRRTATLNIYNRYLQISDKASQHENGSQIDIMASEPLDDLRRNGIHDVANHCDAGCKCDCLIHERKIISIDILTNEHAALLIHHYIIAPLGKSQE